MSILTKEHLKVMRDALTTKYQKDDDVTISAWALKEILDTIDALEAERDEAQDIIRDRPKQHDKERPFKMAEEEKQKNVSLESKGL